MLQWCCLRDDRPQEAIEFVDRAEAPDGGHDVMARAVLTAAVGELQEAERMLLAHGESVAHRFPTFWNTWLILLGMIAAEAGDEERARRLLELPSANMVTTMLLKRKYQERSASMSQTSWSRVACRSGSTPKRRRRWHSTRWRRRDASW